MIFTDTYEITVVETPAGDADPDLLDDNPAPSTVSVLTQCKYNNGNSIDGDLLTYSIFEGDESLFSINSTTGEFSVADHPFDYEEQMKYNVTIHCQLLSDASQSGLGTVNILIGPLNEYRPTVEVGRFQIEVILIPETTEISTVIGTIGRPIYIIDDRDDGEDGVVIFSFEVDSEDEMFFNFDERAGTIALNAGLDIDNEPNGVKTFLISFVVCNAGLDFTTCPSRKLTITVTAENDILPQLSAPLYTVSVNELEVNGTVLVQAACSDGDKITGGVESISFADSVSNTTLSTFEVTFDPLTATANISLLSELDYETTTSYSFSLVCSDGFHTAISQVKVTVLPVNDNSPQFEQENYHFSVNRAEPVPRDTIVGTVTATDADSGPENTVTYSLEPGSRFTIDLESGEITLKDYLSAGDGSTFDFEVIASDGENEARAQVRVTANGLLSVLEWVYVGIGGIVVLAILVVIGIFVFHHFIKAASLKTVVKEKYIE